MTGTGVRLPQAGQTAEVDRGGAPASDVVRPAAGASGFAAAPGAVPTGPATAPGTRSGGGARRAEIVGWLLRASSLVAALGLWQVLTTYDVHLWLRFDRLPTVVDVAHALVTQLGTATYYADLTASLGRIVAGFGLAAILGVSVGVLVGRSRTGAHLVQPLLEVLRPIPAISLVPIAILLFPTNEQGIVFITFVAAFFPIVVSTRHAVRALPTLWEDSVRTLGGNRWDVLLRVVFPGALPGIFGGLSVGIGVAWICLVSAEMISGRLGVGYRTWQAYTIVDYPGVFVGIITIGILGFGTSAAIELLGRRVTRWLPRGEENNR